MTISTKLHVSQLLSWLCLAVTAFCVLQMVGPGMAGDYPKARGYFRVMLVTVVIGITATITYYYLRAKLKTYDPSDGVGVKTLGNFGKQLKPKSKKR